MDVFGRVIGAGKEAIICEDESFGSQEPHCWQ